MPRLPASAAARSLRMSACRLVATMVSSEAGRLTMRAVQASTSSLSQVTSGNSLDICNAISSHITIAWRCALLLVTTVSSLRGRERARLKAKRMMRSTPARVIMLTSVAASMGWPWCTRPPTPAYSPSEFSRTITQSSWPGAQRLSGPSMPGRMRVGRTLAYWSKPWQIFRRRPHSVMWSGMCGSPAEPKRMASLPRSASRPSSGIITPWARK
ncbi:hypothetical protein D9M72_387960 [compost metagenome]